MYVTRWEQLQEGNNQVILLVIYVRIVLHHYSVALRCGEKRVMCFGSHTRAGLRQVPHREDVPCAKQHRSQRHIGPLTRSKPT